ncbi:LysR family transcriptional regulator [Actinomycetospora sp. NBRC 106375]|uniref:LysR family transcriptional regulator n=1 Tax=Actinomycetospora sp. NBRC 106375 TaxID=3032207 RepID=UPI0024A1D568|nr:LysR family transcriptional regulator [Actinomycetospora sp. NBRC 106375]GLZ45233.1 LysR family transcriptional regulator [Actinomycetospora sp. NBRC 106375]
MELRHLEAFLAVADTASFTAAATRLHMTQQSLSRLVAQLERELGVRVFDRTTRSVALTAPGRAMVDPARRSVDAAAEAAATARGSATGPVEVRVDVSSSGLDTGARIVAALRRAHPEVLVHEVEVGVAAGVPMLRDRRLDLLFGLVTDPVDDLAEEVVRREPVVLGVGAEHRLAAASDVPVAELAGERLLLPSDDAAGEWVRFVELFCRQAGVTPRRWPGITHGSSAAAEAVAGGGCVVPTLAWHRPPGHVVFRPLTDPEPLFAWSMISRPRELGPLRATVRGLARAERWLPQEGARRQRAGPSR